MVVHSAVNRQVGGSSPTSAAYECIMDKEDIELVKEWTKRHAEYCSKFWKVDLIFESYDPEVQTFYVKDLQLDEREELQFRHLFDLEKKIQNKHGKRYKIGIIYQQNPPAVTPY